jgi:hypothetical protein
MRFVRGLRDSRSDQFGQADKVNRVARWDGATWHPLGNGVWSNFGDIPYVLHMLGLPNGDLVVAGRFHNPHPWIARWDGTTWHALGNGVESMGPLLAAPNGDLLAAWNPGAGRVLRWNAATWTPLGGSPAWWINSLAWLSNGSLVAGGTSGVHLWDGANWSSIGGPLQSAAEVRTMHPLADNDLIVGGMFAPNPGERIARRRGGVWQPIDGGVSGFPITPSHVDAMTMLSHGMLAVGGTFPAVGGAMSAYLAVLATTCPPAATSFGSSCVGSAGPVVLTATQWPLVGGTMRGRTNGLAAPSLAVGVFGASQIQVPLSSGHPLGVAGCDVLVADEILIEFLTGPAAVDSRIDIPNAAPLIGVRFHHQVVPIELDPSGAIRAITSSNGLTLTIGAF